MSYDHVAGITLGTGMGSALYNNGATINLDLRHVSFQKGKAEDYFSENWFLFRYHELTGSWMKNVLELRNLYAVDPACRQIFEEFGVNLASFIDRRFTANKPELIILGGNISNAFELFSSQLKELKIPVVKSILLERAALFGAGCSLLNRQYEVSTRHPIQGEHAYCRIQLP
jgi:glucokinase